MLVPAAVVLLLLPGLTPGPWVAASPVPEQLLSKIDPWLLDRASLHREGYVRDGTVPVIVMLQAEGALVTTPEDFLSRKSAVLAAMSARGFPVMSKLDLKIIDGFSADVDLASLGALASSKDVKSIWLDRKGKPLLAESLSLIHVSSPGGAWDTGYTGEGVKIAIIDNGFDYTLEELGGCTTQQINDGTCSKIPDSWDFEENDKDVAGGNVHGTKVALIAVGKSSATNGNGVAKDAKLLAYKFGATESQAVAAIDRAVTKDAAVISISYNIPSDQETGPLLSAVNNAFDNGALTVGSIGNRGPDSSVSYPGGGRNALGVGAIYDGEFSNATVSTSTCKDSVTRANQLACWSSRGPNEDGIAKPDVVAPGYEISTVTGSAAGTSFSTPHVAGIAALIKQKHPGWNASQMKDKIKDSSVDLNWLNPSWNYGLNDQGAGRVDAYNALDDAPPQAGLALNVSGVVGGREVGLSFDCTDSNELGDGAERIRFAGDDRAWSPWEWFTAGEGSRTWNLTGNDGRKVVFFQCRDKGGSVVETQKEVVLDTTPPVTTLSTLPPPNDDGWTNATTIVTLEASDDNGLPDDEVSGVEGIWTRLDGDPFERYTAPLVIDHDGVYAVDAYSRDRVANQEPTESWTIQLDTQPPRTAILGPEAGSLYVSGTRTIDQLPVQGAVVVGDVLVEAAADDGLSGIKEVAFVVDGTLRHVDAAPPYEFPWPAGREAGGDHLLEVRARDLAGNVGSANRTVTTLPTTPEGAQGTATERSGLRSVAVQAEDEDGDGVPRVSVRAHHEAGGRPTFAVFDVGDPDDTDAAAPLGPSVFESKDGLGRRVAAGDVLLTRPGVSLLVRSPSGTTFAGNGPVDLHAAFPGERADGSWLVTIRSAPQTDLQFVLAGDRGPRLERAQGVAMFNGHTGAWAAAAASPPVVDVGEVASPRFFRANVSSSTVGIPGEIPSKGLVFRELGSWQLHGPVDARLAIRGSLRATAALGMVDICDVTVSFASSAAPVQDWSTIAALPNGTACGSLEVPLGLQAASVTLEVGYDPQQWTAFGGFILPINPERPAAASVAQSVLRLVIDGERRYRLDVPGAGQLLSTLDLRSAGIG